MENKYKLMRRIYGENYAERCYDCCNCQKNKDIGTFGCIAFGIAKNCNCTWNPNEHACGLFNKPFNGLRPQLRPLVEIYGPKPKKVKESEMQESLF